MSCLLYFILCLSKKSIKVLLIIFVAYFFLKVITFMKLRYFHYFYINDHVRDTIILSRYFVMRELVIL